MKIPAKIEFFQPDFEILEEKVIDEKTGDKIMRVQAKWQHADIINDNRRRYRKELLKREIERLNPAVKEGKVYGASYHPKSGQAEVDDVSHIWEKIWMDESDGSCLGIAKVLPTERGKNAQVLIKHGRLGLSSRGFGTTTEKTEEIEGKSVTFDEVNEDFKLVSPGDFVLTPSVPDAGVRKLIESQFKEIEDSRETLNLKETAMKDFANVDELRKAYPEFVKEIEDAAKKAVEDSLSDEIQKKVDEVLQSKKEEWKKEIESEMEPKIAALEEQRKKTIDGIREAIVALSEIDGVVDYEEEEENEIENKEETKTDETLMKKIAAIEAKNKELEQKLAAKEEEEKKAREEAENQSKIKSSLDEELKKEDYRLYESLIRKELVSEEGKILIDKPEDVASVVQRTKEKISSTLAEAQRQKIISGEIQEKGIVPDPEKGEKPLTEEQIQVRWRQAQKTGSKLSLKEYKEKVLGIQE